MSHLGPSHFAYQMIRAVRVTTACVFLAKKPRFQWIFQVPLKGGRLI